MKIRKKYIQNENVFTIYNLLEMLCGYYRNIPENLRESLKNTYDAFHDEIVKNYIPEGDIEESNLYEEIKFKGNKLSFKYPKEKISYFNLLNLYNDGYPMPKKIKLFYGGKSVIYKKIEDIDGTFRYYAIADKSKIDITKGFTSFLSESFIEANSFEKNIQIIE